MGPKQNREGGRGAGGKKTIFILQISAYDPYMLSTYLYKIPIWG